MPTFLGNVGKLERKKKNKQKNKKMLSGMGNNIPKERLGKKKRFSLNKSFLKDSIMGFKYMKVYYAESSDHLLPISPSEILQHILSVIFFQPFIISCFTHVFYCCLKSHLTYRELFFLLPNYDHPSLRAGTSSYLSF